MSGLLEVVFNIELALIIDIITAFILGFLLFLIKVPNTEYSRKIAKTKNTIAACYMVCFGLFYVCIKFTGIENYEVFSSMMLLVVTAISSAILSFSLINLLDENALENDKFYLNVGLVIALSVVFMRSFWWDPGWKRMLVHVAYIVFFVLQCFGHIMVFRRLYKESRLKVEQYYDEDEDQKIRWIHFCYTIMMLTQMFILVYRLFPTGFMKVYNVWYSIFLLYFAANFISFLGSHKLMLDAFAYKALSGQELKMIGLARKKKGVRKSDEDHTGINDAEIKKFERALEKWVKEKKYSEYDRSREEVAKELGTTREFLHMYFTMYKGMDFKTWRTELRVEESKRLLLENKELSTNVIGEIAGFSDRSNFHRQFVKIVGCTPKQWRESNGNPEKV
ncbi:MAG: AraC family transcriptional regulator [Bacteroidales bacterium]|nr:AraC family transcriptional regulator [Bacteroidales bacterium]